MVLTLAAALSLASSLTIDVPFVPQTDALCGGAAAAMVFRYWGDAHADPRQFASLIERSGGASGIADDVLVRAIAARGWRTEQLAGSAGGSDLDALRARLAARQPVIVLLADRGNQYHYVVVTGATDRTIVVHDPSWGPSHPLNIDLFTKLWKASAYWGLVVLPSERSPASVARSPDAGTRPSAVPDERESTTDPCEASVTRAVDEVQRRGLTAADSVLEPLRARCAESPALMREIAGVRFAQKRWRESEELSRAALARAPHDTYASEVLGAALFMQDDPAGALRAWNAIERPQLDLVRISGLTHSRYQAIVDAIGLKSGALLTADDFLQAERRVEQLPDRSASRVSLRPGDDGFASVDVAIAERSGLPRGYADWTALAIRAAVERDVALTVPGFSGQGEIWSAAWRWWKNRPRVAIGFAAPRVAGFPGVWHVDGSWEAETYASGSKLLRESRTHGGLTVSDWIGPNLRYSAAGGLDSWDSGRTAAAVGGTLERRLLADYVTVAGDATIWIPVGASEADASFTAVGGRVQIRTPSPRVWAYDVVVGATRVGDSAPLSVWSGAGDGHARPNLLRAHPLLDAGVIDAGGEASAFGRTLRYGSAEAQRWLARPSILRLAVAGFIDVAQASRRLTGDAGPVETDIGAGLRLRIPGAQGTLRADVAHGLRDGANAFTVGWTIK